MKQPYNTALYYRLSRDDENFGDSVSIETQRTILQKYAKDNQFHGHYHCSKYGQGTGKCSMHYIRYDTLYTYVLLRVQYWTKAVRCSGQSFL